VMLVATLTAAGLTILYSQDRTKDHTKRTA
jgi:hypothetical protein